MPYFGVPWSSSPVRTRSKEAGAALGATSLPLVEQTAANKYRITQDVQDAPASSNKDVVNTRNQLNMTLVEMTLRLHDGSNQRVPATSAAIALQKSLRYTAVADAAGKYWQSASTIRVRWSSRYAEIGRNGCWIHHSGSTALFAPASVAWNELPENGRRSAVCETTVSWFDGNLVFCAWIRPRFPSRRLLANGA